MKLLKLNIFCLLLFLTLILSFYSCHQKPPTAAERAEMAVADGKVLSQKYCISCHQYPEPNLIDKNTWVKGVLPAMAKQLGLEDYMGQTYAVRTSKISVADWDKIVTYYKTLAPAKLKLPAAAKNLKTDWAGFSLKKPVWTDNKNIALTTFVGFNPNDRKIYSADAANNLYSWNNLLQPKLVTKLPSPATDLNWDVKNSNTAIVTCIGTLPPVNTFNGQLIQYKLNTKEKPVIYADSLPRTVQTVQADFDKNGLMDYAVCGFGHDRGGLYWVKQLPEKNFKKLPIRLVPGATQLVTGDFNKDGWTDLMCLFAQADEGIWLFLNDQKGGFSTKNILHFPPIYGSSSFQLADFNYDGKPDILYTAGDNNDYSKILKPYHGVYIFINQGNFQFKKQFFYHIDGCTKAIAADFKHKGKLDIAVISFFADFKNDPSEGFEYLEQTGNLQFTPHKIPVDHQGRWLTMNTGDYNRDGFTDLILGNFSMGGSLINQKDFKPDWNMNQPIIVLQNNALK
ncbi:MAG: VCBS repeat-containing protein [Sphingobacteriaceae bacterium]|nr:MAG: VCBS repeat-containing protein [Sphingobacteriaceae bacterium]